MYLADVSWQEAQEALAESRLIVIPLGATEVYGRHLPTGSEALIADHVARELGKRTGALVFPTMPVACSGGLSTFVGNLFIAPETMRRFLRDICDCGVSWGATHIFFLNVHGPNMAAVEEVSRDLLDRGIRCAQIDFWRFMLRLAGEQLKGENLPAGHASEMAASSVLAIRPDLVQTDKYSNVTPKTTVGAQYPDVMTYYRWSEITATGHTGNPELASAEAGQVLLERSIERLLQFLDEWKQE